jgi:predicted RecA/RadA family phage recombinase
MKNFVQEGEIINVTSPYALTAGDGCLVGSIFGVAVDTVATSTAVNICTDGIFDLAKTASQAWTVGVKIYWDNSTKRCTTAAAAGANALIGVAVVAVGSGAGETIGRVLLTRSFTI